MAMSVRRNRRAFSIFKCLTVVSNKGDRASDADFTLSSFSSRYFPLSMMLLWGGTGKVTRSDPRCDPECDPKSDPSRPTCVWTRHTRKERFKPFRAQISGNSSRESVSYPKTLDNSGWIRRGGGVQKARRRRRAVRNEPKVKWRSEEHTSELQSRT